MDIKVGDRFRSKHVHGIKLEVIGYDGGEITMRYIDHPRDDRVGQTVTAKEKELEQWEKI